LSVLALAACGAKEPRLMNARANSPSAGPDEFSIVPNKELKTPSDLKTLPLPTPGAANLADADPEGDAIAALGGRQSAVRATSANAPLIVRVSRFGLDQNIRGTLAEEDLAFRRKNRGRPLERLFAVNVYYESYMPMTLDPYAELALLIRRGIVVPPGPPPAAPR